MLGGLRGGGTHFFCRAWCGYYYCPSSSQSLRLYSTIGSWCKVDIQGSGISGGFKQRGYEGGVHYHCWVWYNFASL